MAVIFDQRGRPVTEANPFPVGGAVSVSGSTLLEQKTEADEVGGDLTFAAAVEYVEIVNLDTVNAGTFTVNGVAITVPSEVVVGPIGVGTTPSVTVSVAGSTEYIVSRYA